MRKKEKLSNEDIYKLMEIVVNNEKERRKKFIENAILIKKLFDSNAHEIITGDFSSPKHAILADVRIYYTRNQVYKFNKIYNVLIDKFSFNVDDLISIAPTRLYDITLVAKDKEDAEELIEQAKVLLSRDWNILIKKRLGKITEEDEHEHDFAGYEICKVCGFKRRINSV